MRAWAGRLEVGPRWVLYLLAAALVATVLATSLPRSVLDADVRLYMERMDVILGGSLPYIDSGFEHFPLSALPMLTTRLVAGPGYGTTHLFLFALQMLLLVALTGVVVERVGRDLNDDMTLTRWMVLTVPLLPLVLFRVDPLSVLFAATAMAALMGRSRSAGLHVVAGVAAKGWPAIFAPLAWWFGERRLSLVITGFTLSLVGLLVATPGFREGRGFEGVHLETVAGSAVAWLGALGDGADLVTAAGAAYVRGSALLVVVNLVIGTGVLAMSRVWALDRTAAHVPLAAAVATVSLMLMSPLLSAQFLLWMTPFLPFVRERAPRRWFIGATFVTIVLAARWDVFEVWWHTALLVRNGLLCACAFSLAAVSRRMASASAERL